MTGSNENENTGASATAMLDYRRYAAEVEQETS